MTGPPPCGLHPGDQARPGCFHSSDKVTRERAEVCKVSEGQPQDWHILLDEANSKSSPDLRDGETGLLMGDAANSHCREYG